MEQLLMQMLHPKLSKTFHEYARSVFMPYVLRQLEQVTRLDVVWDVYMEDSLKAATRVWANDEELWVEL